MANRRINGNLSAAALAVGLMIAAGPADAREEIRVVGSSTVFPFSTAAAEQFSKTRGFKTPVVEATGTGGGLKLFCASVGLESADIANASRKIKDSEIESCRRNGVTEIAEVKLGYDGIVIANSKAHDPYDLTLKQIWLALAKTVPVEGRLTANPYRTWRDIDPALPAERIEVLGPPPTSGTRDAFLELVMDKGCEGFAEVKALEGDARKAACQTVREDGAYIEAGENDNLIVQKLEANPAALGIFGFSFLQQNADKLQGSRIAGVAPSFEAITSGQYAVSRSLYFYVKNAHVGLIPGIPDYVAEIMSDAASGEGGYLAAKGLIPLDAQERTTLVPAALALQPMGGAAAPVATVTTSAATIVPPVSPLLAPQSLQLLTIAALLLLSTAAYGIGRRRAVATVGGRRRLLHSLPGFHGLHVAFWCVAPSFLLVILWLVVEPHLLRFLTVASLPPEFAQKPASELDLILNEIGNVASGNFTSRAGDPITLAAAHRLNGWRQTGSFGLAVAAAVMALGGLLWGLRAIRPEFRARVQVEETVRVLLILLSTISILTTIGIVLSLLFEALRFFARVPVLDFLFGLQWSPQTAIRADQVGSSGAFGAVPLIAGTLLITFIAMLVAVPIGLMSAVYMADYAGPRLRSVAKPLLEILAGIPTVVYGFFAALTVAPFLRQVGQSIGLDVASESALAAGAVMGVMIIPFVSSLSDDAMNAVPQSLRDGSLALGATKAETIRQVVIPAALPGIVGGVLLAISRAIGETMIVVMAAGLTANLTANPLEAVTTVTVQIVTLLVGDQEFDSAKTLAAFALGLLLFCVTLALNVVALQVVRRYREKYE